MTFDYWLCTLDYQRQLTVKCASNDLTAHEVRAFAARKLGGAEPQSITVELLSLPISVELLRRWAVEVRWAGDDYAHGASTGRRRLQERIGKKWSDL
jgi:hypothetical protein